MQKIEGNHGKRNPLLLSSFCAILLVVTILFACGWIPPLVSQHGGERSRRNDDLTSPEKTIRTFVAYFNDNDVEGMVSTAAFHRYAESIDFGAYVDLIRSLENHTSFLPAEDQLGREYNRAKGQAGFMHQLAMMRLSLTLPNSYNEFLDGANFFFEDPLEVDQITDEFGRRPRGELEILKIADDSSILANLTDGLDAGNLDPHQEALQERAAIYGCDEIREFAALYRYQQRYFAGSFYLYRFDDRWLIADLHGYLIDTSINGRLVEVESEEAFDRDILEIRE